MAMRSPGVRGGHGGVDGKDGARGLVAEDVRSGDDHGSDGAGVPEVDVGPGACWWRFGGGAEEEMVTCPQMPVASMAMATSPSFNVFPDLTSSSDGSDASNHRS